MKAWARAATLLLATASAAASAQDLTACERSWKQVASRPHDATHFTQGLLMSGGRLFESTGGYGSSALMEIELETGRPLVHRPLPPDQFGEGLAQVGSRLIQLTWRERIARVYDLDLELIDILPLQGEGWGLTTQTGADGHALALIQSDGSHRLYRLHPETLRRLGTIEVRDNGRPLNRLNELEFVDGEILANRWFDNRVVAIDPDTGAVRGWYDFSPLYAQLALPVGRHTLDAVMNGIALDARSGHLLITGKLWPTLFEVEIGGCVDQDGQR